jgi:FMN phosphatase YigB (HAD superfamily)
MITTVVGAGQRVPAVAPADRSFAALDAVTLDAHGTLVQVTDPVPALLALLRERGVASTPERVGAAFQAEAEHYVAGSVRGRDEATLAELRRDCASVFLEALGADLEPSEFAEPFVGAIGFEVLPEVVETLLGLRARGLSLAVVANWDVSVHVRLEELGLSGLVDMVLSSAEVGAMKPDPHIFAVALERLGVEPARALHVGDGRVDEEGAAAAGLRFAPAPLAEAFRGWT